MRGNYLTVTTISGYTARHLINRGKRHRQHRSAARQPERQMIEDGVVSQICEGFNFSGLCGVFGQGGDAVATVIAIFHNSKDGDGLLLLAV